jgi:hypothetical protein
VLMKKMVSLISRVRTSWSAGFETLTGCAGWRDLEYTLLYHIWYNRLRWRGPSRR